MSDPTSTAAHASVSDHTSTAGQHVLLLSKNLLEYDCKCLGTGGPFPQEAMDSKCDRQQLSNCTCCIISCSLFLIRHAYSTGLSDYQYARFVHNLCLVIYRFSEVEINRPNRMNNCKGHHTSPFYQFQVLSELQRFQIYEI